VVFVAAASPAARPEVVRLLHRLRTAGIATEADYAGRSLKAQMKQANRLGARFTLLLGDDELARGEVTVRDMRDGGGQRAVPLEAAAAAVAGDGG
jgi:histidyl-tRNA synthetase